MPAFKLTGLQNHLLSSESSGYFRKSQDPLAVERAAHSMLGVLASGLSSYCLSWSGAETDLFPGDYLVAKCHQRTR